MPHFMGSDPLDSLRLTLMQEVLPVGMAAVERAKRGGARDLADALSKGPEGLTELREEGAEAARQVRERLDRIQPGLGNPVMKVQVTDVPVEPALAKDAGEEDLQLALARISERLTLLEQRLTEGS